MRGTLRLHRADPIAPVRSVALLDTILLVGQLSGTEAQARALVGDHLVPEMVEIAGGADVLGKPGEPSFVAEWEDVTGAHPDVIVLMPCGFDLPRAR
ncbi:MAG TPA: hypothetical protein VI007_03565, partial [bacterium]